MKKAMKWMVVLALLAAGGYWYSSTKLKKGEDATPTFARAKVEIRDLRITVEATGEVRPRNRLGVKPPIAGRLEKLLLDEGDAVEKGQIIGWISSTERATLLDAALATSEAELEYWQELYKPTPLISPLKGTIIARNFEPGQSIESKDAVVVIADDLIVVANLDETDIGQVKLEQVVKVRLEAYPDHEFSGVVEKIAYDARTVSNVTMYEVDVRPARLPGFARSGMTANLKFIIEEKNQALVVPAAAIQQKAARGKQGSSGSKDAPDPARRKMMMERMRERGQRGAKKSAAVSYVLIDSGHPESPDEKTIKTGISDGSYTEILAGLEEGDEVLIQKINLGTGTVGRGSSLMPTRMGRGGGRR